MDMTRAIEPKSDQINADSLMAGPQTYTIESVTQGTNEQPTNVHLVESPGKPYRPGKSMARVMVRAWGKDSDAYVGQRITLYRDPEVKWGGEAVGGIRISHMTGIDKPMLVSLTVTKGQRKPFKVEPLTASTEPTLADIQACDSLDDLRAMWGRATTDKTKALITARKDELTATADTARAAVQDALAGTEAE